MSLQPHHSAQRAPQRGAPRISVVVPAYNAAGTVAACLRALLDLELDEQYEIILVDDGSTDGTVDISESLRPPTLDTCGFKVLRRPHRGAAAARNAGVRIARGKVILFTDADCEPVRGWARVLVDAIDCGADGAKGTYSTRQRGGIKKRAEQTS